MRHLVAALLLAACDASGEPGGSGPGSTTDASVAVGSGGADGSGGAASVSVSVSVSTGEASSTASTSSSASSSSGGAGGAGGDGSGGAGGSGGSVPCESPACVEDARVRCHEACPTSLDCSPYVCGGEDVFSVGLGVSLVQLPPVVVQHGACEACGEVLYSLRVAMPPIEDGCVVVSAPPGISWDVVSDGAACPAEALGCERAAFGPEQAYVHIYATEPADYARDVRIFAYAEDDCVGVPVPDCGNVGCNGSGG